MNNVIKRILKNIKSNPITIIRKLINKFPSNIRTMILSFPNEKEIIKELNKIRLNNKGKDYFLFPAPSCPWGYMFQRPQQLARTLAENGNIVIYMVDTSFPYEPDWLVRGVLEVEPNIYLVNDNNNGLHLAKVFSNEKINIWQYWPHQLKNIKKWESEYKNSKIIYDCIDHIETFDGYTNIDNDLKASIEQANIVLATAKTIENDIKNFREDVIYVPNAVNIEDFTKNSNPSDEFIKIRDGNKVIVGYYGAIAKWFDFKTVSYLAENNPDLTFLIVGETYPDVQNEVRNLKKYKNIIVHSRISYKEIPGLLSVFDIAILPFIKNNITINTSPVKVFEYLAGGKPTVSVDLPEVNNLPSVFIAKDNIEFNNMIHHALKRKEDDEFIESLKAISQSNTWHNRIELVINQLESEGK